MGTGTPRGCWHHRQWLQLLYHNTNPLLKVLYEPRALGDHDQRPRQVVVSVLRFAGGQRPWGAVPVLADVGNPARLALGRLLELVAAFCPPSQGHDPSGTRLLQGAGRESGPGGLPLWFL